MTLYIKQKFFSFRDRFSIYDYDGNELFNVVGEIFTFGKKLHLYDAVDNEIAYIHQKVLSFLPRYFVFKDDEQIAEIKREFRFFKHEYTVNGLGWKVYGDFFDHEYEITDGGVTVARVTKEWFTLGDAYQIYISDQVDLASALAVVLVIDACLDSDND